MTTPDPEQMAALLTKAQREIMLGHLVDIPPEECGELEELGLKNAAYFHEEADYRRMVWPITPLGLAVRNIVKDQPND